MRSFNQAHVASLVVLGSLAWGPRLQPAGAQTLAGELTMAQGVNDLHASVCYDGKLFYGTSTVPGQVYDF